ncbi:MAG: peptidoglycan DD-metalloendopeptidase family protein [Deltaproteobacteria bacterium]|nr:peptidoglycan DD-metalloendopeptidase family protein [Deltaproteobacteria bacterium]NIS76669.1 peptidoglycan DD-metalloendopeptidase family protein [Deltaproteobacteria bacterium]
MLLFCLFVVFLCPGDYAHGKSEKKKLQRERSRLIELKKKSEKAKKELERAIRKQKRLKKNVGKLEKELNAKLKFLKRVDRELKYVETLLNRYDKRISELKGRRENLIEAAVSATEISFYKEADFSPGLLSFVHRERDWYVTRLLIEELDREMEGVFTQEEKFETKVDSLEDTRKYWEKKHKATEKKKKNIETQRKKKKSQLAKAEREKARIEKRYRKLKRDIGRLQKTVSSIEKRVRKKREKTKFARTVPSGYTFPARGTVVTKFGRVRDKDFNIYIDNKGIEIKGKPGGGVRAVHDGVVVYQGDLSGFGIVTVIEHRGDIFTVYGKAALYNVKVGDKVKKGQKIGRFNKGSSPVVYFELRIGGKPVNPLKYIKIPRA